MQAFQRDLPRFEKLNAQVLGISGDDLQTHREFSEKFDISFPLIADDGALKDDYGKERITYIIDQSGIIRFIQEGVPDNEVLLKELKKLK
jgi:peroxiredoxin Q/BCP